MLEHMRLTLLLPILHTVKFVDSWSEVRWVTSKRDLE